MRAGQLRHRLVIESAATTSDAQGGVTTIWTTFDTLWAKIEPMTGAELLQAQALQSSTSHRITIRYRSGILASMRGRFGARIFNFRSILNMDEKNQTIEILADEGVGT